mmetsp:Transcript_27030/g.54413  ORF Transcript_27030/g.54413 Transcript_27030/m.54413 type:complete len:590 (+) Transcript_27030:977-2746(+)
MAPADELPHQILHLAHLVDLHGLAVGEVEAQLVRSHDRAPLVDGIPRQHLAEGPVEEMGGGVVGGDERPALKVNIQLDLVANLHLAGPEHARVQNVPAKLLCVLDGQYGALVAGAHRPAHVEQLPAGLRVEVGLVQYQTHKLPLRRRVLEVLAVPDGLDSGSGFGPGADRLPVVLAHVVGRGHAELLGELVGLLRLQHKHHLALFGLTLRPAALLLHLLLVPDGVDGHPLLLCHEQREVDREPERVVEHERMRPRDLAPLPAVLLRKLLELRDAAVEGLEERDLFLVDHLGDLLRRQAQRGVAIELWEGPAQNLHYQRAQPGEEPRLVLRSCWEQVLLRVPHAPAEDAADDVVASVVARHRAIRDRNRQRPDVVGDDAVRHVHPVRVLLPNLARVRPHPGLLADRVENGGKDVGVVVGHLPLQNRRDPLHAHPCVDVLSREESEGLVLVAEHLDEDHVPDLEHVGIVHVDEVGGVAPPDAVVVELSAGPARPGLAHLPEVVLHVPLEHAVGRKILQPELACLLVRWDGAALVLVSLAVGGIESVGLESVDTGEQLPGPRDCLLLEVGGETPVAQHLEEGMVVHVLADIV